MNHPAVSPCEAAPTQVCALWTELLARLSLAAVASAQAQTRLHLRALGVRRTGTVATNLARELSVARRMAASAGVLVQPLELQYRVGELAQPGALGRHLPELAGLYRRILLDAATPPDGALARWLAAREHVHLAQHRYMEQSADWSP